MADHRSDHQRRRLLQAGAGAAALGAIPGAGQLAAHAQGAFDWKSFKGEKIEVFLVKSPRGDLLTKYHKEFEDLTGITVGSEMIPEQQQRQKAVIEFNSGNPSFDVIAISYHVQKRLFGKNKWLEDVRPLIADKSLADPNLDFADFAEGRAHLGDAARRPHRQPAVQHRPVGASTTTRSCSTRRASRIRRPSPRWSTPRRSSTIRPRAFRGFVGRGLKNANVPVWSSFLLGYGGGFVDAKGKLMTDTPEAIEAAKMYQTLLAKYGPAGCRRLQLERVAEPVRCRARRRCGSTASASRSRSRTRPSRASSARSATA